MSRRRLLTALTVAIAACGPAKVEPPTRGAVVAEALTTASQILRMTVEAAVVVPGVAIPETDMSPTGVGHASWQNVSITPGTYDFTFRAYAQTAGSGTFTVTSAVVAGDSVTVAQGASAVTFQARESLEPATSPFTQFNLGGIGAWGKVTLAGVVAGDTVLLNGVTFTAIAGAPSAGSQDFEVGASDTATAVNLTAAINGCTTPACDTALHSSGIRRYLRATQAGPGGVHLAAAPGPTGRTVQLASTVGAAHFTFDAFSNHPGAVYADLTADELAAAISANATTAALVSAAAAGGTVTVTAKTRGRLATPITLASSGANITFTPYGSGVDLLAGATLVSGVVISADATTVLDVAILDTTTRDPLETGPVITAFTTPPTPLHFSAAPDPRTDSTAYVVGDVRTANGSVYICSVAGTSGPTPPAWGRGLVVDGAVTWRFVSLSPNAWTTTPLTFSATISTTPADSWAWSVSTRCPSGLGTVAAAIDGEYATSTTGSGSAGLTLGPVSWWFASSAAETCTVTIRVDKIRNIAAGANTSAWVATYPYAVGDLVRSGSALYVCTVSGTSGAVGPSGAGRGITEGTVTWDFVAALPVVIGSDTKIFQVVTAP